MYWHVTIVSNILGLLLLLNTKHKVSSDCSFTGIQFKPHHLSTSYTRLILTPACGWQKVRLMQPDLVWHFKKPCYHFCHRHIATTAHCPRLYGHRGPLSNVGVDVKMVGSKVVTPIVQPGVGGGPRGYFSVVRHGRENGTLWIDQGSGSGQRAAQLALKAGGEQLK